jgi:phenylacetate-coenzyme A ligase PaaK-like adenylate-forming protein
MNWNRVSHLSNEDRRALQNRLVSNLFRHQLPYSPFYRKLFADKGLSFSDIRTTDDLVKLPFVSKADLAPTDDDRAKPRQFMLQPDEHLLKKHASPGLLLKLLSMKLTGRDPKPMLEWEYKPIHLHFTTGRTALPTPFSYSARDILTLKESGKRLLEVSGANSSLVGINGFPYSPHLAFWLTYNAMTTIGMTSLQTGGGKIMGTQKIIDAIERLKAGLATFIPGYAYHLFREAAKQQRDFSNLQYVIFGGDRVSDGLREKVKMYARQLKNDHLKILATYAMTEGKTAWIQCAETSGYHTYPDLEFLEVVDPEGQRVKEGERGELVYTALDWRGSVVVRYRTGDLVPGIMDEPCPHCGRTVPIILPDVQRVSEMKEFHLTKIKGELINLNEFYPILSGHADLEEWQVTLKKRNNDPYDVDEVVITVTPKDGRNNEAVCADVARLIRNQVQLTVEVETAPLQELLNRLGMETELKEKRIVDQRPK